MGQGRLCHSFPKDPFGINCGSRRGSVFIRVDSFGLVYHVLSRSVAVKEARMNQKVHCCVVVDNWIGSAEEGDVTPSMPHVTYREGGMDGRGRIDTIYNIPLLCLRMRFVRNQSFVYNKMLFRDMHSTLGPQYRSIVILLWNPLTLESDSAYNAFRSPSLFPSFFASRELGIKLQPLLKLLSCFIEWLRKFKNLVLVSTFFLFSLPSSPPLAT